ncbi:MAG TPA: adenylosuccinate synthase, partial [Candidatus Gracilibacteria bacterium]|nr:adenylosuccinate synthase [Candidatus Gracilibacteria bacterium]
MPGDLVKKYGNVVAILGGQWGDEGKGKLIDIMAEQYDIVARAAGGANAGHTVYIPDPVHPEQTKKFIFRLMPSGVLHPTVTAVIGNGCVVHLPTLFEEIEFLKTSGVEVEGRVMVSDRAHLVFEYHKIIDGMQEEMKGKNQVGTTKRGIGPAYTDKISRIGIRVHDLLDLPLFEMKMRTNVENLKRIYNMDFDVERELEWYRTNLARIKPLIVDSSWYLNNAIDEGKKILLEGANGALLDIDHGTYPFVTSSNASIGGIVSGTGISGMKINGAIGIMKAYCTRVGAGPFPTELEDAVGEKMRTIGGEFGSVTGRPRRCGWFDAVASRYSVMVNGLKSINLTKLDVLDDFDTLKIGIEYVYKGKPLKTFPASTDILDEVDVTYVEMPGWKEKISGARTFKDLPENAQKYVKKIEELLGCPVESIGVG